MLVCIALASRATFQRETSSSCPLNGKSGEPIKISLKEFMDAGETLHALEALRIPSTYSRPPFESTVNAVWCQKPSLTGPAFTVDSNGGRLYVDGILKASRAWSGSPA